MTEKKKIEKFYTEVYDEFSRLEETKDLSHKVEIYVKTKILEMNIAPSDTVCEIGAGTGFWVNRLLSDFGCKVAACDIVPKHVDILKARFASNSNFLGAFEWDVRHESPKMPVESFDFILMSGPMYHISSESDKRAALRNAGRLMIPGKSIMAVDWLSENNALWETLLNENCRNKLYTHCGEIIPYADNIFSYMSLDKWKSLLSDNDFEYVTSYALDGISRFVREKLDKMTKDEFNGYCEKSWIMSSASQSLCDVSEHSITLLKKL